MVPRRSVEGVALEALEPGQRGRERLAQEAGRDHQHPRGHRTGGRLELPALRLGHPVRVEQLRVQPHVGAHAEAVGAPAQVLEDLVAHRIGAVPVRVRRERERVEVRGDVALAAGIAVGHQVPPTSSSRSITMKSVVPRCFSRMAMPRPAKPAPTMATSCTWVPSTRGTLAEPYLAPVADVEHRRRPAALRRLRRGRRGGGPAGRGREHRDRDPARALRGAGHLPRARRRAALLRGLRGNDRRRPVRGARADRGGGRRRARAHPPERPRCSAAASTWTWRRSSSTIWRAGGSCASAPYADLEAAEAAAR